MKYITHMEKSHSKKQLGLHIRNLRENRELTLADLTTLTGVSRASLSRIENGDVSPTAETLGRLATALETPISQLISPLEHIFEPLVTKNNQPVWIDPENELINIDLLRLFI